PLRPSPLHIRDRLQRLSQLPGGPQLHEEGSMTAAMKIPASVAVSKPNEQQITEQANGFLDKARQIVVRDEVSLAAAATYLQENKAEQKRLDEQRRSMVDPLNGVVRQINALFKPVTETLAEAERIVKGAVSTFQVAEQR